MKPSCSKIIQYKELINKVASIRRTGKDIVLVTGVFDLLHAGHKIFLEKAKEQGDILLVCLESDQRVKAIKGKQRPIEKIELRIHNVVDLSCVDFALALPSSFDSIERDRFISIVRPNILAVSSHTLHIEVKRKLVEKYGGKLRVVMERDERYSTSKSIAEKQSDSMSAKQCLTSFVEFVK